MHVSVSIPHFSYIK